MASETVSITVCAGGTHLRFTGSGAKVMTVELELTEISKPVTDEEAIAFVKVLGKLAKAGRSDTAALARFPTTVTV